MRNPDQPRLTSTRLRNTVLLALAAACVSGASEVAAQYPPSGNITVFADAAGSSCVLLDETSSQFTVYIIHTDSDEKLSSDFRVLESAGFLATYISESILPLGHFGDFRSGISLGYGLCQAGSIMLGSIVYQGQGASAPCSYLDIVAHRFPWPATQACVFSDHESPPLGKLYVNPQPGGCEPWCLVATRQSTWGSVKSLYRN
jgi:hypothetical protein